jgi:ADP-heptose:LPS heptosyltransferase
MGYGDELLVAGQAKKIGKTVEIWHKNKPIQNELYKYIPYLGSGVRYEESPFRGYITDIQRNPKRIIFNRDYRAEPAIIDIEPENNDYIIIEPTIKRGASRAKQWHHYQQIVDAIDAKFLQFCNKTLDGTDIKNTTLTEAARLMAGCRLYVGAEGFLHHLAAAFGKPAVVIMGAFSHPKVTGYDFHTNIWIDDPDELGSYVKTGAMEKISPEEVIEACRKLL